MHSMEITVKQCRESDLEPLAEYLYRTSPCVHNERLKEQQQGSCSYLIAWHESHPVGHIKIHWHGSVHVKVKNRVGIRPEIRRLYVDDSARSRGVATKLILDAEQRIVKSGDSLAGLAVGVDNRSALRLYQRLGYEDWGYGTFKSALGFSAISLGSKEHLVTYMIKRFQEGSDLLGVL